MQYNNNITPGKLTVMQHNNINWHTTIRLWTYYYNNRPYKKKDEGVTYKTITLQTTLPLADEMTNTTAAAPNKTPEESPPQQPPVDSQSQGLLSLNPSVSSFPSGRSER